MRLLNEEHQMVRDMAAGFLEKNAPVSALRNLRDRADSQGYDASVYRDMAGMGWTGMMSSEDVGGLDLGAGVAGLVAEEMGRRLSAAPFLSSAVMAATMARACNAVGISAKIASGNAVVAMAFDELSKHRPDKVSTKAEVSGNGFVLSGSKRFVSDAVGADAVLVTAMTDQGLGVFLVDPKLSGVVTNQVSTVDSRNAASMDFNQVVLGGDTLIAQGSEAESALALTLRVGRSVAASEMVGLSKEVAERTNAYLRERKQFGVALAQFQALQHRAADLYTQIQTTEAITSAALAAFDANDEDAERLSRVAKAKANKTASLAVREAVQMHGGIGMTDAIDIGLFMKKARACIEYLGDDSCHAEWLLQDRGL
nr:acyl-CoA dehydrogenase family protein [uncultured Shimia sp.]